MTARRHHIIPQMILRRFVDEDGLLHVVDRKRPQFSVRKHSPENALVMKDLNAFRERDGTLNLRLARERALAQLVDKYSPKLQQLLDA